MRMWFRFGDLGVGEQGSFPNAVESVRAGGPRDVCLKDVNMSVCREFV